MNLPWGWRTGGYDHPTGTALLASGVGLITLLAAHIHSIPYERGYYLGEFLVYVVTPTVVAVLLVLWLLRVPRPLVRTARRLVRLGLEPSCEAVEDFLGGAGLEHAALPPEERMTRRVFEVDGGRLRVELDLHLTLQTTRVVVGPLPRGEDPGFEWLLAGLGDALEGPHRAGGAPRQDPPRKPGG